MQVFSYLIFAVLALFQIDEAEAETLKFILTGFGVILLVIILTYILLTSKQE